MTTDPTRQFAGLDVTKNVQRFFARHVAASFSRSNISPRGMPIVGGKLVFDLHCSGVYVFLDVVKIVIKKASEGGRE
jgi:hypothetical protein